MVSRLQKGIQKVRCFTGFEIAGFSIHMRIRGIAQLEAEIPERPQDFLAVLVCWFHRKTLEELMTVNFKQRPPRQTKGGLQ